MIHHGFKQGKRVLVILKSGEKFIGKFISSNSNSLILDCGKFGWKDIRATTINKNRFNGVE